MSGPAYPWRLNDSIMPGGCVQRLLLPDHIGHNSITARKTCDNRREWSWWTTVSGGIERGRFPSMHAAMSDAETWVREQGITPDDCETAIREQRARFERYLGRA